MTRGRKRKGFSISEADKQVNAFEDKKNQNLGRPITDLPSCISIDILVRLSVKRIFICKRVCKTWCNLISSPEFAKHHFERGDAFPLIRSLAPSRVSRTFYLVEPPEHCSGFDPMCDCPVKMKLDTKLKTPLYDEDSVIESVDMDPPPKAGVKLRAKDHEFKVANSCNGLLCLCEPSLSYLTTWSNPIAVCNPITSEFINLPDPIQCDENRKRSLSIYCGLGFSPNMNQYKVLRIRDPYLTKERESGSMTEIHTIGSGSWRRIGKAPYFIDGYGGSPTYLNGSLHWLRAGELMSFDFDKEKFQSLPPPPFKLSGMDEEMTLGVLRGCLCICDESGFENLKVWVMKEYGVQGSWSIEFCFYTLTNEGKWMYGIYEPICCLRNGAILLFHRSWGALFYHDPKKRGFKFLKLNGYKSKYEAFAHTPSFISLKDALKGDNLAVFNTKSRYADLKLQGESKDFFLVEEDPAMRCF